VVHGYGLLFQLKYGEHPLVSPAQHEELASTRMPFAFDTASFDLARVTVRAGERPPADEIRVEEFLAAHDYSLPKPPASGLALHLAGSVSPLGGGPASHGARHLLELVVQAASHDPQQHYPNRLIVAVDASSHMRRGARLDAARRALAKLAERMNDRDRVTLLRFAEQPTILAKNATADELNRLVWSDALSAPSGAADLPRAIEAAWEAARDVQALDPRHVVVVSGERGNFDATVLSRSVEQLRELAEMNIPWRIVRLAAEGTDAHWADLAAGAQGKVVPAHSPAEVYDSLLEALANEPTLAAESVSVSLTFNPEVVAAYRLVGHEARTLTGLSPDPVTIDLRADQTALCLYEITLKPPAGSKSPAAHQACAVEVTWRHPSTHELQRIARPIARRQLSGSFTQAPAWFQEAVVVAKAAEVLRGSYYAPTSRGVGQVLDLADQVDPRVTPQPDFQKLVELLKKAEKLR
jgi:Ca-activated chloride channel family protein